MAYASKHTFMTQPGWLRRLVGTAYPHQLPADVAGKPSVTIPLEWLGLEEQKDNPISTDPALIAAKVLAYDLIAEVILNTSTEMLRRSLEMKRTAKETP